MIIHLHLWLNEKLGITNFVSLHLPAEYQGDSMSGPAAAVLTLASRGTKQKSDDYVASLAFAITHLANGKTLIMVKKNKHTQEQFFLYGIGDTVGELLPISRA
jgi:hypothetical protein